MSDLNKELQKLANINEDACEFYEEAQEKVENPQLNTTFKHLEALHKGIVINLQEYISANGGTPNTDETIVGEMREMWGKLTASISNDVDQTLVSHLEEAEDRCLHSMQDAMEDDDVPASTKTFLQKELNTLRKSHDYMKALKDCMKAA